MLRLGKTKWFDQSNGGGGKGAAEGKNIKYLCFSRVLFEKKKTTK